MALLNGEIFSLEMDHAGWKKRQTFCWFQKSKYTIVTKSSQKNTVFNDKGDIFIFSLLFLTFLVGIVLRTVKKSTEESFILPHSMYVVKNIRQ